MSMDEGGGSSRRRRRRFAAATSLFLLEKKAFNGALSNAAEHVKEFGHYCHNTLSTKISSR